MRNKESDVTLIVPTINISCNLKKKNLKQILQGEYISMDKEVKKRYDRPVRSLQSVPFCKSKILLMDRRVSTLSLSC